jgi:PAS domain-containing protein
VIATTIFEPMPEPAQEAQALEAFPSVAVAAAPASPASEEIAAGASETARTLTAQAHVQAVTEAACLEAVSLRQQLQEAQASARLLRANAEQARRVAESLRGFHEMLLVSIAQPCFALDRSGQVIGWNPALERWSGLARTEQEYKPLDAPICSFVRNFLDRARRSLLARRKTTGSPRFPQPITLQGPLAFLPEREAEQITLLPLFRIPGTLEAVVVLLQPAPDLAANRTDPA